jgi:hypothetical protein
LRKRWLRRSRLTKKRPLDLLLKRLSRRKNLQRKELRKLLRLRRGRLLKKQRRRNERKPNSRLFKMLMTSEELPQQPANNPLGQ